TRAPGEAGCTRGTVARLFQNSSGETRFMITGLLKKVFGSRNDRLLRQYMHGVRAINALEAEIAKLSDAALQAKTTEFKQRNADGESLDKILPEAFAVVREAAKRVLNMRHFDVQLIG